MELRSEYELKVVTIPPSDPLCWFWHFDEVDDNVVYSYSSASFFMSLYQKYLLTPTVTWDYRMEDMDLNCPRPSLATGRIVAPLATKAAGLPHFATLP